MTSHTTPQKMNLLQADALSRGASSRVARIGAKRARRRTLHRRITGFLGRLAKLRQRRAVIAELNMLSDHELADIGLARVDVPHVFDPDFISAHDEIRSEVRSH